jgi:BirA family biotin operon repressor/biotin-[acetyl-CoA-carboxylase] ligase
MQIIGQSIIHLPTVDSTNDYAQQLLAKSNPIDGTVIVSDFQTHGKGQRHKIWQSARNVNLLMSIILYPANLTASNQFYLSMTIALAVTSYLQTILDPKKLRIKWPNDLYFETEKIGGILIQNNLRGSRVDSSVVGIGLNINQSEFDPDLPNPTSIMLKTGNHHDLEKMKPDLLATLDQYYSVLRAGDFEWIKKKYESLLFNRSIISDIRHSKGILKGIIIGVKEDGRLVVNVNGEIQNLVH